MKLSDLYLKPIKTLKSLTETGYGRTYEFMYRKDKGTHAPERKYILILGTWTHPTTGNRLVGAISLGATSGSGPMGSGEISTLQKALPAILKDKGLKERYWNGRKTLPSLFKTRYRTYDSQYVVGGVKADRIKFISSENFLKKAIHKIADWIKGRKDQQDEPEGLQDKPQQDKVE